MTQEKISNTHQEKNISNKDWEIVFNSIPDLVMILDLDNRILAANPAVGKTLGVEIKEIIGRRCCEIFHLSSEPPENCPYEKLKKSHSQEESFIMEMEALGRTYLVTVSPILENGKMTRIVHIAKDITEKKSTEEINRRILHAARDGFFLIDTRGRFCDANAAACRMTGYSLPELLQRTVSDIEAKMSNEEIKETMAMIKKQGGAHFETLVRRKDQSSFSAELSIQFTSADGGYFVVFMHDNTEHMVLQAQLQQAQKMEAIGTLAGGVAHDFNNILSVILGYSDIILEMLPEDSPIAEDVRLIVDAGERAAALTKQLLAFSRKQVLAMQEVDMNSLIENMTKMWRRIIGEDIELELNISGSTMSVFADIAQIENVLMNLVVNARDAMPKGGRLLIETADIEFGAEIVGYHEELKPGQYTMVAISDTGVGMSRETQKRIFEPFFTTKKKGKGTGLGLATVYGIVKQHNGYVYVYSEPGKGTTFKIYLPNVKEEQEQTWPKSTPTKPKGNETILVVEDDETIRKMISKVFTPLGYTILEASNGNEALKVSFSYREPIDLLLTDVIMPGMNGREVADKLKVERPEIKVIFISGYTDESISQHGVLEPDVILIQKPLSPNKLAKKLRSVLDE